MQGLTVLKNIGVRLNLEKAQETQELEPLFEAFRIGINWSLKEIEKRYQTVLKDYKELPKDQFDEGVCPVCSKEAKLSYIDSTGRKVCMSCARRGYSEYTVRKEIYAARGRTVDKDLKNIVEVPNNLS